MEISLLIINIYTSTIINLALQVVYQCQLELRLYITIFLYKKRTTNDYTDYIDISFGLSHTLFRLQNISYDVRMHVLTIFFLIYLLCWLSNCRFRSISSILSDVRPKTPSVLKDKLIENKDWFLLFN